MSIQREIANRIEPVIGTFSCEGFHVVKNKTQEGKADANSARGSPYIWAREKILNAIGWINTTAKERLYFFIWVAGILLLILPRMIDINNFVDSDEAFSILLARQNFGDFMTGAIEDRPHPPLHVLMLFVIAHLHLDTALFGRVFGIAGSIAGFFILARVVFRTTASMPVAIAVLLVFAFSDFFLYRSTTIRPYSIIIPLGCVQLYFFVSMLREATTVSRKLSISHSGLRWWTVSSVFLMWAQYLSVPVTGTEFLILALFLDRAAIVRIIAVLAAAALGLAFWYYLGSVNAPSLTETWWATHRPGAREFIYTVLTFFGAAPVSAMWLGALFAFIYANALFKWRFLERFEMALAAVVFVPLVAIFLLSALGPLNVFAQRHFIIPALALVVLTCSLTRLMHRGIQWVCLSLIVAWAASSLPLGLPRFSKPPFEEIVASLAARDIKRVYTTGWEFHGLSYYAGSKFDVRTLAPPMSAAAVPIDDNTGFVCRPGKCRSIFDAVGSSGIRVCGRSVKWNMRNYVLSEELWFFFPATKLRAGEICNEEFLAR